MSEAALRRLHEALRLLGADPVKADALTRADALWLARVLPGGQADAADGSAGGGSDEGGAASTSPEVSPTKGGAAVTSLELSAANGAGAADRADASTGAGGVGAPQPTAGTTGLFVQQAGVEDEPMLRARRMPVPAADALPGRAALERALRPFLRRRPSRVRQAVDAAATAVTSAEASADALRTGDRARRAAPALVPVLRPVPELWFDVVLLAEQDDTMRVFEDTLRELRQLLARHGAFRRVGLWRWRVQGGVVHVETAAGMPCAPRAMLQGQHPQIVWVLTHGASDRWNEAPLREFVRRLAAQSVLAIVQLLPEASWGATALGEARERVCSRDRAATNRQLLRRDPWSQSWSRKGATDVVPLLPLRVDAVARWADFVMSPRALEHAAADVRAVDAAGLSDAAGSPAPGDWGPREQGAALADGRAVLREQVLRFKAIASPQAFALLRLLSGAWITLPVMRLLQHSMPGPGTLAPLAEVLLSGLLRRTSTPAARTEELSFDFAPGVREWLSGSLSGDERRLLDAAMADSREAIRQFVEARLNRTLNNFGALLLDPAGDEFLPASARSFVEVSRRLRALRGDANAAAVANASGTPALAATNDLFLSYRRSDRPSVEPVLEALRARGVRVWQDAREVEDFAAIQRTVETGLSGARAVLVWYSVRYNASRACQWALTAAYCCAQAEGDPRRRILVVNPEEGNAHVHLPDLFDQLQLSAGVPGDAAAVEALADRIRTALGQVPATALGALRSLTPPLWLPAMGTGSNRFVGRLREMWQLHGALQAGQAAMLTGTGGKPGLALVRGAGGIGKSLMAEEYALRFGAAYPGGVFWLRAYGHPDGGRELDAAQRSASRDAQLIDIAARLEIDTANLNPAQVQGALVRHFAQQGQPFLWVVDDLPPDPGPEGLGGWQAPHPLGCTLFTTRTGRFAHVSAIELPQLDAEDARLLLTRRRSLSAAESDIADALCALLGYHALAVDVAATLVERRGLAAVREALQHPSRDALALAAELDEALPNGHQRQIAETFLASIRQLDGPAHELLRYAAVLAVAPIPPRLLVEAIVATSKAEGGDGIDADAARDRVDLGLSRLLSTSLADDAGGGAIAVHTLVSRTIRFADPSPEAWAALRARMVDVLSAEMVQAADIRQHADLAPWVTHARDLSESSEDLAATELLGWVARFDLERASYALARSGFERQYQTRKRVQGEEHPDTLTSMSNLASTLGDQGDLPGARRLQEAVLEARKRVLGEEHPDTLTSMSNLAATLRNQGDLPGARRLEEAVLEARRRVLGEEHPDTLTSMSNLASTLRGQGDVPGARKLQESALGVQRRVLGEEHPDTLTSMNNLALTLRDQGDLPGARRLEEAVLEARKRVLGEEHPDTLTSMSNLAQTLQSQGDVPGAKRLQVSALEVQRRVLGEEHPDTLTSMNNLAMTLRDQGDLPGARRLQEACVAGLTRTLGPTHANTEQAVQTLLTMGGAGDSGVPRGRPDGDE